jgi:hypothetical protein
VPADLRGALAKMVTMPFLQATFVFAEFDRE